ncbi:immunoglobulin lambda-1 light chain-like [Scyliorhinus torazame]|uniref:immunoglobulin lambda-1 light chain-like n=1 Tax=Scyliorhinus torazame TaxID=75743 RepID=UPI003B5B4DDF
MGSTDSGQRRPLLEHSTTAHPHAQIIHFSNSLTIFLLLLFLIGCLHGDLVVVQEPSFVSGLKGQSVTLYCSYTSDGEDIFRSVVYWFIKEGEDPTVIHPAPPPRYQNRVKFSKYSGSVNTTFQIHPLQLKDTETYYCYISFLVGEQTFTKDGVGTRLFVHEPLVLTPPPNCSCDAPRQRYISCGTQVLDGNLVWIDWLRNGEVVRQENETRLVEPAGNGSERLESQLPLPVCCLGKNLNYTCMLNHISGGIIDKSKHTVVRESPGHPLLLYVLTLGKSAIILLLVLVCGLRKGSLFNQSKAH